MLLVQYPESGTDALHVCEIPFDADLASDILRAGDDAWNHIQGGRFYQTDPSKEPELSEEERFSLGIMAGEFARNKAVADSLYKRCDEIKTAMGGVLSGRGVMEPASLTSYAGVKVGVGKPEFNLDLLAQAVGDDAPQLPRFSAELMEAHLKQSGADMNLFETGETRWDEPRLIAMAQERNLDLSRFQTNPLRFSLSVTDEFKAQAKVRAETAVAEMPTPEIVSKATKQKAKAA